MKFIRIVKKSFVCIYSLNLFENISFHYETTFTKLKIGGIEMVVDMTKSKHEDFFDFLRNDEEVFTFIEDENAIFFNKL